MTRQAKIIPAGGDAFDVECREGGALVAYLGCPQLAMAQLVARAFVLRGLSNAQRAKQAALAYVGA